MTLIRVIACLCALSLPSISQAEVVDGVYVAGYETTFVKLLNRGMSPGSKDLFTMVIKDGQIVEIKFDGDPDFNRSKTSFDKISIDHTTKRAQGIVRQVRPNNGPKLHLDLILDVQFGEQTFVGKVDVKLVRADRVYNQIVERGVFEGIKK
jgi:hypothetical protein